MINAYLARGDLEEVRRGLKVAESKALIPSSILMLLKKFLRMYDVIYEYRGRVIPV